MILNLEWQKQTNFVDLNKAREANEALRDILQTEKNNPIPAGQWNFVVHNALPHGLLRIMRDVMGPDGKPYMMVYVPTVDEINALIADKQTMSSEMNNHVQKEHVEPKEGEIRVNYDNFASICSKALKQFCGLAICLHDDPKAIPETTIRLGGVFSFLTFKYIGGPWQLIQDYGHTIKEVDAANPFQGILDKTDTTFRIGQPSFDFLPEFIRNCITDEIRHELKEEDVGVKFTIREQNMYAMRRMIVISTSKSMGDQNRINQVMQSLTWYMPYYLPLAHISEDGFIDQYT